MACGIDTCYPYSCSGVRFNDVINSMQLNEIIYVGLYIYPSTETFPLLMLDEKKLQIWISLDRPALTNNHHDCKFSSCVKFGTWKYRNILLYPKYMSRNVIFVHPCWTNSPVPNNTCAYLLRFDLIFHLNLGF